MRAVRKSVSCMVNGQIFFFRKFVIRLRKHHHCLLEIMSRLLRTSLLLFVLGCNNTPESHDIETNTTNAVATTPPLEKTPSKKAPKIHVPSIEIVSSSHHALGETSEGLNHFVGLKILCSKQFNGSMSS